MHRALSVLKWVLYGITGIVLVMGILFLIVSLRTTPSNDRDWNRDQQVLPYAEFEGNLVTVHNIRNFTYASTTSYVENYYDKTFDLNQIKRVWYVVEPFSGVPGSAHTFLSFEFEGNEFLAISVEIRKEKGETYHPLKGLFNAYELMYVIGDERDLITLRANHRKDPVYLYPMRASKDKAAALFVDMLTRANTLRDTPEFYNTLTNTCTTNIVEHVNTITPHRIPFLSLRILLPENSDALAYELGLIDTDLTFPEAREKYHINERAFLHVDDPAFSVRIRE